jgi:hypothetical protein
MQLLGHPGAAVGALQGLDDQLRKLQDRAEIRPHQLVELAGGNEPRRTAAGAAGADPRLLAQAAVIPIAGAGGGGGAGNPRAGQAADPTADQPAQQVRVGGAAPSAALVGGQPPLHQVELLSRHQRGDRHRDPLLGRVRPGAHPLADRFQRRLAAAGRSRPQPTAGRLTLVGRVGQQPTDRRRPPDRPAGWGRHPPDGQLCGQPMQRHPTGRVGGKQLLDHGGGDRVDLDRSRVTGPLGVQPIPVRCSCPRQQPPAAQPRQPPAPHPIGDQGPLVLGDRAADLGHQLLVRVVAWRPIAEHHLNAPAFQLLQHHHLVHQLAGQPVRRGDQHHVEGGPRRLVAQRVQARTVQLGAAVAVIAKDVLLGDRPPLVRRDVAAELGDLLLDGLGVLLAVGGHTQVQRHSHQLLPLALPSLSSPSAGQAGTPDPTAPARPVVRWSPAGPRRCAACPPSHCCYLSRKGYTARRPPPQGQPPPVQPKLAMTGPTELVTCDQTIERRIAFVKVGRHVRIAPADLDAYIAAGRVDPLRRQVEAG